MNEILIKLTTSLMRPKWIKYCSQTLYESLSFCNNMYIITSDNCWKNEALTIIKKIRMTQKEDGGFDIGYEFNFGKIHKKGWSSAPECKMFVSLIDFGSLFGFDYVNDIIVKGINWIINNSIKLEDNKWIIPYCPDATKELIVYNGISFALAPLANYYNSIEENKEIKTIHDGYINYLYDEFEWEKGYWKYFDQNRENLTDIQIKKVDNYHLAQQLEMHCYSYKNLENSKNRALIDKLSNYLLQLYEEKYPEPMPYLNYLSNEEYGVHLWGYASLINGFLSYYDISNDKRYLDKSREIFEWIGGNTRINNHFMCIFRYDNNINKRFYPRSDAWVINNLSNYLKYDLNESLLIPIQETYHKIKKQDFSGFENHASTRMSKIINYAHNKYLKRFK